MVVCEGKNTMKSKLELKGTLDDDDDDDGVVSSCGTRFDIFNDKSIERDLPSTHLLSTLILPLSGDNSCNSYSSEIFEFKGWKSNSLKLHDPGPFLKNAAIGKINNKATKCTEVK